jgi:hypothetical protein
VFVVHEVAAVREIIQGRRSDELNYRTDFVTPADRRCPREGRPRKKDRQSWCEVNKSRVTGKPEVDQRLGLVSSDDFRIADQPRIDSQIGENRMV